MRKEDEELLDRIMRWLTENTSGDAYGHDGAFAASLASLPVGARAMAATHWLDISLTLDSITWHFGNFGEPGLVRATEEGLRELGLIGLADCFVEAEQLMIPLLANWKEGDGDTHHEILEKAGLLARSEELDDRAWELHGEDSTIYQAWVRYARANPERVFRPNS